MTPTETQPHATQLGRDEPGPASALRIAVLVKQIPKFEAMTLGPDGRLQRQGLELEMNAYCRRAVSKGVELASVSGGRCIVFTLGPPTAEDVLREAVAWGADEGVLITDPVFAGSDTLATARALAAALEREGPDATGPRGGGWDLVLTGRNSVDADTGQVGPQLAELLDLPFATGVRELEMRGDHVRVRCEHDDEWVEKEVDLPAVLSCAERLCDPSKVPPEGRAAVAPDRLRTLSAGDLGPGPWGQHGSPTSVGEIRVLGVERLRRVLDGSIEEQVDEAVALLVERGALRDEPTPEDAPVVLQPVEDPTPAIAVLVEPARERGTRELLGAAADLASRISGRVVALGSRPGDADRLGSWGADAVVVLSGGAAGDLASGDRGEGSLVEEDVARGVRDWAGEAEPWAVLAPSTPWGREVASRVAAGLGAGLTGDAVGIEVEDGRLVAWKPAFGGSTVAAVRASSSVQLVTVRAGVLPLRDTREVPSPPVSIRRIEPRGRVRLLSRTREDDVDDLANARRVIGIGQGVDPEHYDTVRRLAAVLDAELAATRKVTDRGWLPRARQIGITGHSISPTLFVSIGSSGKFNHTAGIRQAGTVLAINNDPAALVWEHADIGIVGRWEEVVPVLERRLAEVLAPST